MPTVLFDFFEMVSEELWQINEDNFTVKFLKIDDEDSTLAG